MTRTFQISITAAATGLAALLSISEARAHCFVGSRFFPATLAVDDPCVADELSYPTISQPPKDADTSTRQTDFSAEYSKRLTEDFGVSVGAAHSYLRLPGVSDVHGWQNVETTFKYQFLTAPESEFVMSAGLSVEWGNTGNASVGAEKFSVLTPTLWFGQGLGALPDSLSWARPFAITGQFGYAVPTWARTVTVAGFDPDSGTFDLDVEHNARFLEWGGALQYNLRYLQSSVVDIGLPDFAARLIPLVEAQFQTPVANRLTSGYTTTGSVNPGFIWVGNFFQVGAEAIIPINRQSGRGVGWAAQIHFYLDDMFPTTIARPVIPAVLPTTIGRPMVASYAGSR